MKYDNEVNDTILAPAIHQESALSLAQLATSNNPKVRFYVSLQHHNLPTTFALLSVDTDRQVRRNVARNETTPVDTLTFLLEDKDYVVLAFLAQNLNTPLEVLKVLAQHPDPVTRGAVAHSSHTPVTLLVSLANDSDILVLREIASNHHTPQDILTRLANNADASLRSELLKNPNLAPDTAKKLFQDPRDEVNMWFVAQECATKDQVLAMYNRAVANDVLDSTFIFHVLKHNVLPETELAALVAVFGSAIARYLSERTHVPPNSILAKSLEKAGYPVASESEDLSLQR